MQKNYKLSNAARLSAYSAMAAALTASASDVMAEVIYTDIDDVTIGVGDQYLIDVDGDGTSDFMIQGGSVTSATSGVWSFVSAFGYVGTLSVGNAENQFIGYIGSFYNYGSALEEGALIGPDGPWLNYPSLSNSAVIASNFYGSVYGAFPGQGERYLGFQFTVLGNIHYGWMRLEADIDPTFATLMDFAYESIPNQAIEAGSLISDIKDLPAGAVQAYSHGSIVYINHNGSISNAMISMIDMQGRQVFSSAMTNTSVQIDMSRFATGNYFVQIRAEEGKFVKQVTIH